MRYERERTVTLKPQDILTPVAGVFIFQARNSMHAEEKGYQHPEPYGEYLLTIVPLAIISVLEGTLVLMGLNYLIDRAF